MLLLYSAARAQERAVPPLSQHRGNLEGEWLFRTDPHDVGEKGGWQKSDADESSWRTLNVPGYWEVQGVTEPRPGRPPKPKGRLPWTDYDGVAWYRLRFVMPAKWRGQPLLLRLGSVDDEDRTFLNGALIGTTGPGIKRAVSMRRVYRVPSHLVRLGKENVLAVRVFDGGGPGGLMGPLVSLLPKKILEAPMTLPQSDRSLEERFTDPPAASRILKIVHSLPDDPKAQDGLITSLISQGFGGMACNVSFHGYVESEPKWQSFVSGVKKAKEAGMSLWLYDERGYPSGTAGGITLRGHPEWEARGLLIAEATSEGGRVDIELPPGKLRMAWAFPVSDTGLNGDGKTDLAEQVANRKLSWEAPAGRWHVMVVTEDALYDGTHAAVSLHDKLHYINLLMPEPTARFIEVTHAQYAKRLGHDLGPYFVSTFTDEPSLMSRFFQAMPYRVLPWSANLPVEFQRRRGYALEPAIPALIADTDGCQKTRHDFWLTVGELVSENYFGQIQGWCRQHGLASGGHLLLEEPIVDHVALYGDFFRCVRRLSAPSIDCLTSIPAHVPWQIARLISSAAELNGSTVTMCETSDHVQRYRRSGDKRPVRVVTEDEIRGTCNRLILGGINTITSYYSFSGLTSAQLRRLNLWVGRCCTMLKRGHQVSDIAVVYPIESLWPKFRPARKGATDSASALKLQGIFNRASDSLYNARRDFTYVDSKTLAEAKVADGSLVHRDLKWRVVVLPGVDTLPMAAWQNLERFWREGGIVISLGALPQNSEREFPSADVQALCEDILPQSDMPNVRASDSGGVGIFLPDGSDGLLPIVLDGLLEPDVRTASRRSPIRATHRHIDDHEVYFVINDSGDVCEDRLTFASSGTGELWAPATGERRAISTGQAVDVRLEPYGGVFLRFAAARKPKRLAPRGAALPGLTITSLPPAEPTVGKGQFVRANVARQPEGEANWRAVGTLTKSDVDTHLFLSFDYPPVLDLSTAHSLVFDTWVPRGQQTPVQLLVILGEKGGAHYIAHSNRPLGSPGHVRSFVPLDSFRLAGWSKDPKGRLDLDDIVSVKIGWGGYFGQAGEVIEFAVALPQAAGLDVGGD